MGQLKINTLNLLSSNKKIDDHIGIFVRPTINLMITDNFTDNGQTFDSDFAPYSFYSHTGQHPTLRRCIGVTAGIHIH